MTAPAPVISAELKALLRRVKLGRTLDTLPERMALAKTRNLGHGEFLELVLSDEVTRRDTSSADLRARTAGLDPTMRLEHWDDTAAVAYDHQVLDELVSLRFVDAAHNALILGPVGVGKTFIATALGHAAIRRRTSVHFERGDQLLKRLKVVTARQQPRHRDPKTAPSRPAHHRRFLPPGPGRREHRRHLPGDRRTPPSGRHRHHLEPRAHRVARPHGRRPPGAIRHRPAPIISPRTRPRRRKLPATPKTRTRQTRHPTPTTKARSTTIRSYALKASQAGTIRFPHTPGAPPPRGSRQVPPGRPRPAPHLGHEQPTPPPLDHDRRPCQHRQVNADGTRTRSHATGGEVVPSRWRATPCPPKTK